MITERLLGSVEIPHLAPDLVVLVEGLVAVPELLDVFVLQLFLEQFRGAWEEVLEEELKNEDVKKLWDSYQAFHEDYKIWGEMGYLD